MRWSFLPNLITLARIALTVPLVLAILRGDFRLAIVLAIVAGISDALDGLLAKRFGWQSRVGGLLDPVADKLMLVGSFAALARIDVAPDWMLWLVLGRDLVIVTGAVAYHVFIGPLFAAPTRLSKATTCLQILLVVAWLAEGARLAPIPDPALQGLLVATALATAASGLHYVALWTRRASEDHR